MRSFTNERKPHACQETNSLDIGSGTNARQDDDVLFLSLESIDSVKVNVFRDILPKGLEELTTKLLDLSPVHGHDTNPPFQAELAEPSAQFCVQFLRNLNFSLVLQRVESPWLFVSLDIEELEDPQARF